MYDPTGEHLTPVLQGIRLAGSAYVRQLAVTSPDGALTLHSETLGLELRAKNGEMRFRDPATGRILLSYQEEAAARRTAESRVEREVDARRTAESRVEREAAARREAESHAEQESVARRAAEARVTELEALLRERSGLSCRRRPPRGGGHQRRATVRLELRRGRLGRSRSRRRRRRGSGR